MSVPLKLAQAAVAAVPRSVGRSRALLMGPCRAIRMPQRLAVAVTTYGDGQRDCIDYNPFKISCLWASTDGIPVAQRIGVAPDEPRSEGAQWSREGPMKALIGGGIGAAAPAGAPTPPPSPAAPASARAPAGPLYVDCDNGPLVLARPVPPGQQYSQVECA